ncbi:MAG TPA: 2-succinyl-5-enolpyruvyl-6-hydroxy-3-cyclohexene-1-carboxylate synthase, partial [Candidatus Thermoplasmatota archaeon]|nr:2-succinyl-5-enolpyruvyl-6-hydroxy-3-cyclohexene-1-carboxylate synthase [Candidatus Thermoplasmatota archaeon]
MPPVAPNKVMLWATVLAEELARSGVAHACVAPGNRSGPLAFALAAQPIKLWSHVDERSMGFFALG